MRAFFVLVSIAIVLIANTESLQPTKLVSGQSYKLQNQHDGRFLTDRSGQFARTEYSGSPSQKFLLTLVEGNNIWTLTSADSPSPSTTKYKITYVGHGKYQFMNLATNMCIKAGGGQEGRCIKDEPTVRWYADHATTY